MKNTRLIDPHEAAAIIQLHEEWSQASMNLKKEQAKVEAIRQKLNKKLNDLSSMSKGSKMTLSAALIVLKMLMAFGFLLAFLSAGAFIASGLETWSVFETTCAVFIFFFGTLFFIKLLDKMFGDGYTQFVLRHGVAKSEEVGEKNFQRILIEQSN